MIGKDILGQNARNMLYIHPHNPRKAISFANSKLRTKQFLEVRDIPVPKLYGVISSKQELSNYPWHALPDSFVLKPNSGFGGEGIVIINGREEEDMYTEIGGKSISEQELQNHVLDILDGRYALASLSDKAIFEQLIVNHPELDSVAYEGICDIRILVYNLVPVMAMMRIPTKGSGGKANVHLGGIGAGIDMGRGTVTHLTQFNRLVREVPGVGNIRGMKIPHWDEMLLIASKIQQLTGIGYLAVDLAIDASTGPVLLEINARAGLMLQVANLAPLRRRLERVKGIKIKTPAKGVRIAQDLFGGGIEKSISYMSGKEVVGLEETVTVLAKDGPHEVQARMDLQVQRSQIHPDLFQKLLATLPAKDQEKHFIKRKLVVQEKKITTVLYPMEEPIDGVDIIIGKRDLKNFLIDPNKYVKKVLPKGPKAPEVPQVLGKPLAKEDEELSHLASYVKVLRYLKPLNLEDEKEKFLRKRGNYNPKFVYRSLDFDAPELVYQLEQLHFDDSPLGRLLHEKRKRLLTEVEFITTIGKDQKRFLELSDVLYGRVDQKTLHRAEERWEGRDALEVVEKTLTHDQAAERVREVLEEYELHDWKVVVTPTVGGAMAVNHNGQVKIREGAMFDPEGLESTILHEIETHVFRGVNGSEQEYDIFRTGTATYLKTEEGLAVYVQEHVLSPKHEKYYRSARTYMALAAVRELSFRDGAKLLLDQGWAQDLEQAFHHMYRFKRGLRDTKKPGVLTRDLIYFRGYCKVADWVAQGGDWRDLYLGKIALSDVEAAKAICEPDEDLLLPDLPL